MGGGRGPGYLLDQRKRETAAEPEGLERASRNTSEHTPASEAWAAVMPQAATAELPRSTAALRGRRRPAVELFNINFGPNSRALVLAEILNVVQVFTTAHAVTVCYCGGSMVWRVCQAAGPKCPGAARATAPGAGRDVST